MQRIEFVPDEMPLGTGEVARLLLVTPVGVLIAGYLRYDETLAALEHGPAMLLPNPINFADIEAVLKIVFKGQ